MSIVRIDLPASAAVPQSAATWRVVAAVMLCVVVPLAIFAPTVARMVSTWRESDTFAHCFFVFPAFVYMVWRERFELAARSVQPAPFALLGVLASGFVVTLGSLAAALTPSYFGVIGLSIFTVIAVLGWRMAGAIWVPLLFLFFAVPFGEVFVPSMVEWTADFTVAAVAASGVPVYREGPNFVIPSGQWSVVGACSGVRYLMASMFAGWLYAWLAYRSTGRRLAFMAASIVVPIVANWFRAYTIVMLAHLSGNEIATGVDHFVYGWVFFGIVIGLLFWGGTFFREDVEDRDGERALPVHAALQVQSGRWPVLAVAVAALVLASGWQLAVARLADYGDTRPVVVQPLQPANGWTSIPPDPVGWAPRLRAPAATLVQQFEKEGRRVTVHIGVYRNQSQESELVNSLNVVTYTIASPWLFVSNTTQSVKFGNAAAAVNSALGRRQKEMLVVWQWYWIDGKIVTSDMKAKASLAIDRLLGRSDTSAWVAVYGIDDENGRSVRDNLAAFAADMGPAIEAALRATADQ